MIEKTAMEIYNMLNPTVLNQSGKITFSMAGTSVTIDTTDTVGNTIQSWLKQWMINNNIYNDEPENTQAFPDFYLSNTKKEDHMLEVKAFNYNATPAFDIANYESYVLSVSEKPYRLNADYIIFGYVMDELGNISLKKIWLKKIWEIAGFCSEYALKVQIKKKVIYNIRPNSDFKKDKNGPFSCKEEFLKAIYETQKKYRGQEAADEWKTKLKTNYKIYYSTELNF